MITVGELVHSVTKAEVLAALARLYHGPGEDPEGYSHVFDELCDMQPLPTNLSCLISGDAEQLSFDVSGIEDGDPRHYGIEFVDWRQWLSMPVIVDPSMGEISQAEMLAHVMAEMTWAGYSYGDAEDFGDEISDLVDEAREMLDQPKGRYDA
jgi:hypothetical protein